MPSKKEDLSQNGSMFKLSGLHAYHPARNFNIYPAATSVSPGDPFFDQTNYKQVLLKPLKIPATSLWSNPS